MADAVNLITNGDFERAAAWETGGLAYREEDASGNSYFTVKPVPNGPESTDTGTLTQMISTAPGKTYTVTFTAWQGGTAPGGNAPVEVEALSDDGEPLGSVSIAATGNKQEYTMTFVADSLMTNIRISGQYALVEGSTLQSSVDNFSVVETQAPSDPEHAANADSIGDLTREYFAASSGADSLNDVQFDAAPLQSNRVTEISDLTSANFQSAGYGGPVYYAEKFSGPFEVSAAGTYTFYLNANNPVRLIVDGKEIVNQPSAASVSETVSVDLASGPHKLELYYLNDVTAMSPYDTGRLDLDWSGPGLPRQQMHFDGAIENLAANGSFDQVVDGKPVGWDVTGDGKMLANGVFAFQQPSAAGEVVTIQQTIDTVPGKTYTITFAGRQSNSGVNGGPRGELLVEAIGLSSETFSLPPNDKGVRQANDYSLTFVATSEETIIKISDVAAQHSMYATTVIDDVRVVHVEPEGTGNTITGTAGDDWLVDTDADDTILGGDGRDVILLSGKGDDAVDGQGGGYNQIDLLGNSSDYTFSKNADGSVTVTSAAYGTDTLKNIDGVYFYGDDKWCELDDLLPAGSSNIINGTAGDDYLRDTRSNDWILAGDGNDVIHLSRGGSDFVDGQGGDYNQVDLQGAASDYDFVMKDANNVAFTNKATGEITTLRNIDGVYFYGEGKWYDMGSLAVPASPHTITGTAGDDYLKGTLADDIMLGGDGLDVFVSSVGNDVFDGQGGPYNQVDFEGAASDYAITKNADGSFSVSSATSGNDTLKNIGGVWFSGENKWYALESLATAPAVAAVDYSEMGADLVSDVTGAADHNDLPMHHDMAM